MQQHPQTRPWPVIQTKGGAKRQNGNQMGRRRKGLPDGTVTALRDDGSPEPGPPPGNKGWSRAAEITVGLFPY